jgi:hypothetical protein
MQVMVAKDGHGLDNGNVMMVKADDEAHKDDESGEKVQDATSGGAAARRQRSRRKSDPLTRSHIVEYNQHCLKAVRIQENKLIDAVHAALPRAVGKPESQEASTPQRSNTDETLSVLNVLVSEAHLLSEGAIRDDRAATAPLRSDPPALSRQVKEGMEHETKQWWHSVVDKAERRILDSSGAHGKAFADRLAFALSQSDSDAASQELSKPLQQLVEQYAQDEMKKGSARGTERFAVLCTAGTEQLRDTLRSGANPCLAELGVAVNAAMSKAKTTWSDETIRKAAQRQRVATQACVLVEPASKETANTIRDAIRSVPLRDPAAQAAGVSDSRHNAVDKSLMASLLERVRKDIQPLKDDLESLAAETTAIQQSFHRCRAAIDRHEGGRNASDETLAPGLASKRAELLKLCTESKFDAAFRRALSFDGCSPPESMRSSLHSREHFTEWLCQQALVAGTPEDFLSLGGEPIRGDTKLCVMAELLHRSVLEGTSLEQAESNLDWVSALQQLLEITPDVHGTLNAVAGSMAQQLADLSQGRAPQSLVQRLAEGTTCAVTTKARFAAKQLKMCQRSS